MPDFTLADLGWTDDRVAEFAPFVADGFLPGRVVLEHNHVFRVFTERGEQLAESAGRMKHRAEARQALPVVGDWVVLRYDPSGSRSQIRHVLPRRGWFSRKAAGRGTHEQVVAANIDTVLIVFGLDTPVNRRGIERYLVVAQRSGARPVIVLNKADLVDDVAVPGAEAASIAGDTPIVMVSAKTDGGVQALTAYLKPGKTLALIGPSGAGKSSLVNQLVGRAALPTGEVRDWDARGRHTSVHRQLIVRESGGLIIDTPGMREVQLWESDGIADTFADVELLSGSCRFRDCRHDREPDCAVKAGVEAGALDAGRYQSFLKLQGEQAVVERLRDERALVDARRANRIPQKPTR